MRIFARFLVVGLCLAGAYGCSHPKPPQGKWEGTYESDDTMVVARLEIASNGAILVSAPNAQDLASHVGRRQGQHPPEAGAGPCQRLGCGGAPHSSISTAPPSASPAASPPRWNGTTPTST